MAISNDQKIDYLWKKIGYGRAKTDTAAIKDAVNESISSALLLRGDNVWAQSNLIPTTIPGSSTSVVTLYPTSLPVECTADTTSSTNRTWKTNITDWIPPEIGSTYLVKVYVHTSGNAATAAASGTQLVAAGSGNNDEWFFDYQSGTLNFIGTNLPSGVNFTGKSVYISGAVYSGIKGVPAVGSANTFTNLDLTGNLNVSGVSTFAGGIRGIGIQSGSVNIATGIITALNFVGSGNSISYNAGTKVVDISIGGGNWEYENPTNTYQSDIYRLNGNVGIGTIDPTSKLDVRGNVNVSGIVTATVFVGDGSGLTGITASGSGIVIKDSGSLVGTAGTIDFGDNLTVSTISAGVVTVTSSGGGGSSQWETTAAGIHTLSNVGIGTTNPTAKLQVNGNINLNYGSSTTASSITWSTSGTANVLLKTFGTSNSNTSMVWNSGNLISNPTSTNSVYIGAWASPNASGTSNVSIGSGCGYLLSTGASNVFVGQGAAYFTTGSNNTFLGSQSGGVVTSGSNNTILGGFNGNSGGLDIRTSNNNVVIADGSGNIRLYANSTGNIGIGTTNPTSTFTVVGNALISGVTTSGGYNATTGNDYKINETSVLNATTLGSGVVNSSLTSVGTLTSLNVSGTTTANSFVKTGGTSNQFLKADGSIDTNTYLTSALQNVVEDTTPQLGGNLDLNSKNITGTGDVNITGVVTATSFSGSGANLTSLDASNISSGIVSTARLASGTADSTTYLRGDQTWASISGGGATLSNDTTTDASYYPTFSSATSGTYSTAYVSDTKCTFNPSTGTLSATQFTSLSDKTQKTNIRLIDNSIELVKQLEGVRYDWINNNKPSIGVIAQDIEKVLPEVVETNSNGLKSVSYGNIVGVLIEAIKEQQIRIEELEKKLNA